MTRWVSCLLAVMIAAVGCGATTSPRPEPAATLPPTTAAAPSSPSGLPSYLHVLLVLMENHGYDSIVRSSAAPYINGTLAARGALAADYHAIAHPSLPNYIDLTAGQDAGITTDCAPGPRCTASVRNLADELEGAGRSWKAYQESMPAACQAGNAGPYDVNHNPFVYFDDLRANAGRCHSHVVPYSQLSADVASGTVPSFAFITPDVTHDMHDGSVDEGDAWLRQEMPPLLALPGSLVIVTWDEGDDNDPSNHVATVFDGPGVAAGSTSHTHYTHFSLLRTIEALQGVGPLTRNDRDAQVMADLFAR